MSRIATLAVVLLLLVATQASYQLSETEQAVVTQFGAFVSVQREPGLHFKVPFVQSVHVFDKWILEWNGSARDIPTREKQLVFVATYARWRIADPRQFYETVGDETGAHGRLDDIIDASTRDVVSANNLIEIVRDSDRPLTEISEGSEAGDQGGTEQAALVVPKLGRSKLEAQMLQTSRREVARLGIELLDVRIRRVEYVEAALRKLYERMNSERHQKAAKLRAEGQGVAEQIEGEKSKELARITSEAYKKVQEIEGAADAAATRIYAEAYGQDARFYAFTKTLETYRQALKDNTVVVLSADSDLFRLLKEPPAPRK